MGDVAEPVVQQFGAAEGLEGMTLIGLWKVEERIRHDHGMTGASRSACYRARSKAGDFAFVKAFDFRHAEHADNTDLLETMVREFNYEKNIHNYCIDQHINRVTRIYAADKILVDGEIVHFIICEWANKCLRESQPPGDPSISLSARFAALRDVASAHAQLHKARIAHQDAKPSNAMCPINGAVKLADLGSSSCERMDAPPHDLDIMVGQPGYAPYELLYEQPPSSWERRRFGCDLFLLGNLCFTSLVGGSLSILALHSLPRELCPTVFSGHYADVMPHLIEAHELLIPAAIAAFIPEEFAGDVSRMISALCHPDPMRRGHPKNLLSNGHPFGLERFIGELNLLSNRAKALEHGHR
jgi:serine/threonine protein kinase